MIEVNDTFPELMTENELIQFLRIPEASNSRDYHNVVRNLIRFKDLPPTRIRRKILFPRKAILEWIGFGQAGLSSLLTSALLGTFNTVCIP